MGNILWGIIVVLVVLWLIGFALQIGGGLIHFLLVVAGIVFVYQLITGKRKL
ncbi:lmo0937 family membrane protein [Aerococcaceae bacterium DSM 109653]|uniref:Lmo0937 family membrane protein n=1 Tax=Fundicoccus ignavus TaxID=2664442 RepID=A0A844BYH6_9LACT|nr:lmo0937 family membrane protein [Fundicoccus ignavus]MRI82689.1 lmo0937 family membrane protein [Fundicoccus ignavus]